MTSQLQPHAIFIDFDGTLGTHGVIPATHVKALSQVRANGHLVFLCTGRPRSIVFPEVADLLDGVIGSAGCYVEIFGKVHQDLHYEPDLAKKTISVLESIPGISYALESTSGFYGTQHSYNYFQGLLDSFSIAGNEIQPGAVGNGNTSILQAFQVTEDLYSVAFSKVVFWGSSQTATQIASQISPDIRAMPNSVNDKGESSGELQLAAVDKIDGIHEAIKHLQLPLERTIACGDGLNDVQMLNEAGTAVVITGSTAEKHCTNPKQLSVPGPESSGLKQAFDKLGLI